MSGALKKVPKEVRRIASKNAITDAMGNSVSRYSGPEGFLRYDLQKLAAKNGYENDTRILEGNPTTPLTKSDTHALAADQLDIFGVQAERALEEERIAAADAARAAIRPLPDPNEIARARRRKEARKRSRGRASTVLSDGYDGGALGG